ncbi:hypothetical protein Tco_1393648 [Tanacetum coccineum]
MGGVDERVWRELQCRGVVDAGGCGCAGGYGVLAKVLVWVVMVWAEVVGEGGVTMLGVGGATERKNPNQSPAERYHFDTESYLLESLLNRDTLMASSPKIDSLFDEFAGELITIPPRIVNREHEEYISLLERLLYDTLSPRPPEDFHANPNTIIESLPTFPIPVKDSGSLREEIDIFPGPDDSNTTYSTIDVVEDIPIETRFTIRGICIEGESRGFLATHSPVIDNLLPFSSENEDKAFNYGILASKEKSPPSSSHRGFKASKLFHHKIPMLIQGENTPNVGVRHLYFYPP